MIKLLIFDLDGTLIDSASDIVATTNALLESRGLQPLPHARIVAAIGEGLRQLIFDLFPETHSNPDAMKSLEKDFLELYEQHLLQTTTVFPGVERFLDTCQKTISIVTNKNELHAKKTIAGLPLHQYSWLRIFGADSLKHKKPDPLPLLETINIAGVAPHETLMIGDGIPDMIAARRAGVHSVAISFGYTDLNILQAQGASLVLNSYGDFDALINEAEELPPREISDT
jgi:phosphoglycolate phosphatase